MSAGEVFFWLSICGCMALLLGIILSVAFGSSPTPETPQTSTWDGDDEP